MKSILLSLVVFVVCCNTSYSQILVKQSHPRILLDSVIINKLQIRASNNTPEWQELTTRINAISGYNSQYIMQHVYAGEQYAFMYALSYYASGNIAHRDSSISLFKEYFNKYTTDSTMYYDSGYQSRSTMVEISMLYDWLYNELSPSFRNSVRARLIHWGNWILNDPNVYGIWYGPYYYEGNNYSMGHFVGLTSVGFSIQSEDPVNGNYFISKSDSIRPFLMNYTNTRLRNGDANEGWGYGAGYAINYFKALAIYKTATNNTVNHFANTTYDEDVVKFLPFATLPNLTHILPEGDWARESTGELWEYHRLVADLVSSYSNDIQSQQIGVFWGQETVPFNKFAVAAYRWFPFLYSNKEVTPINYRTLPLYQSNYIYTDTIGTDQFIRRTGWNVNSQWVSYRGGGRYGDHAHNGSGHFSVFKKEWLIIDKNIKYPSGIEGYDSVHNCIHVQNMNNFEMYPFSEPIEHTNGIRRDLNQEYSYLWTNSAPIYKARTNLTFNCVEKNQRQFFYIPGLEKIAIFDIIETNNNYKKWFGLNYNGNVSLANDSSYSYYSNSLNTAYVNTCYPLNKSVYKYDGRSIRVGNKTNQAKDYFMHLVSVLPNGTTPINVIPVNRDNGRVTLSDFYGSYHKDNSKDYCILFAGDNPTYNYDSLIYIVPTSNQMLHSYISGLEPSTAYYVSFSNPNTGSLQIKVSNQNHSNSILYQSTSGGVLSFDLIGSVGIKEANIDKSNYHVFYNKNDEEIVFENQSENESNPKIKLYDIMGKNILSKEVKNLKRYELSVSTLSKGVYIVILEDDNNKVYRKKISIY